MGSKVEDVVLLGELLDGIAGEVLFAQLAGVGEELGDRGDFGDDVAESTKFAIDGWGIDGVALVEPIGNGPGEDFGLELARCNQVGDASGGDVADFQRLGEPLLTIVECAEGDIAETAIGGSRGVF